MKCLSLKHNGSGTKILALDDTMVRIGHMMRSHRLLLTGRAPKSPPSHRAHHWTTQICHNIRNTQASLHIFKSINKA
jgi:hypothetical protein